MKKRESYLVFLLLSLVVVSLLGLFGFRYSKAVSHGAPYYETIKTDRWTGATLVSQKDIPGWRKCSMNPVYVPCEE